MKITESRSQRDKGSCAMVREIVRATVRATIWNPHMSENTCPEAASGDSTNRWNRSPGSSIFNPCFRHVTESGDAVYVEKTAGGLTEESEISNGSARGIRGADGRKAAGDDVCNRTRHVDSSQRCGSAVLPLGRCRSDRSVPHGWRGEWLCRLHGPCWRRASWHAAGGRRRYAGGR